MVIYFNSALLLVVPAQLYLRSKHEHYRIWKTGEESNLIEWNGFSSFQQEWTEAISFWQEWRDHSSRNEMQCSFQQEWNETISFWKEWRDHSRQNEMTCSFLWEWSAIPSIGLRNMRTSANIADGVGEMTKVNCFSLFAWKALLCWGGAATTEYWRGWKSTVCTGSLRKKYDYIENYQSMVCYLWCCPVYPCLPHPLARCGEGTCLHIYSKQADDRDTMLHNHTLFSAKDTTVQIYRGIGMWLCKDCEGG